jgi:long-chain-fatty-acid--[acyl-carrier-protein] ligase
VRGRQGPFLILPNHPAYVDPMLVLPALWPRFQPRPMLYEANFRNLLFRPLLFILNAVRVPDLEQASLGAREQAQRAIDEVIAGLQRGDNVILWPSGRLQPPRVRLSSE